MTIRRVIYVDGVFDIFHYGHMELFRKIKLLFPNSFIIAGVSSDHDSKLYKRASILTCDERVKTLSYCKYIDKVISNIPWIIDNNFIEQHKIDYVCHDPIQYPSNDIDDVYKFCKEKGIFIGLNRTPNISTTEIIKRIKNIEEL